MDTRQPDSIKEHAHAHALHGISVELLITIVDRGKGQVVVNLLQKEKILFHRIVLGRGTAKTEMLNLLGIGDTAKDIVFSVLPNALTPHAMHRLSMSLQLDNPGHGIAFSVPIGSVGGHRVLRFFGIESIPGEQHAGKEHTMETTNKRYDLIMAIVDHGFADDLMDAARPAGAKGGTVIHARGAGIAEAEKFFGITIQPEKEMVLILASHETKRPIMEAICHKVGLGTDGHGIVLSLPVDDVMGVARMLREDEEA